MRVKHYLSGVLASRRNFSVTSFYPGLKNTRKLFVCNWGFYQVGSQPWPEKKHLVDILFENMHFACEETVVSSFENVNHTQRRTRHYEYSESHNNFVIRWSIFQSHKLSIVKLHSG